MGNKKDTCIQQSLNEPCEVTKLQRIFEKVKVILNFLEKRLKRAPGSVRKAFTFGKFVAVFSMYDNVIRNVGQLKPIEDLYAFLYTPCFLLIAYDSVKKNMTVGLGTPRRNNLTLCSVYSLSKEFFIEQRECSLAHKLFINKLKWGKVVFNARIKIMQKALQMLWQPAHDFSFSNHSYGFGFSNNCHSVVSSVRKPANKTAWFIMLDLEEVFEKAQYLFVAEEIKMKISDPQVINLIPRMLTVVYIN